MKNTIWAREFFQQWWDGRGEDGIFCDQHMLNRLYAGLLAEAEGEVPNLSSSPGALYTRTNDGNKADNNRMKNQIVILEPTAMNSKWPAIETMSATDRVLHLMGETASYRTTVAQFASKAVCDLWVDRDIEVCASEVGNDVGCNAQEETDNDDKSKRDDVYLHLPHQMGFNMR